MALSLAEAALNRGTLRYQQGRLDDAARDLKAALASAGGPKTRGAIHYNLGLIDLARGDDKAALASLDVAVLNGHPAARALRDRLAK